MGNKIQFITGLFFLLNLVFIQYVYSAAGTVGYQYDNAGRLIKTTTNDGNAIFYDLDATGNRTQAQKTLASFLQFSAATISVSEAGTSVTVSVNRTGSATSAVSIGYATANGTATAANDYTAKSGTLSWAAGDTAAKTISIGILNDTASEGAENFTVTLSSPTGGAVLGATAQVTVTINDDEAAPTYLQFATTTTNISESGSSVVLTVNRTGSTTSAVSLSYATSNNTALSASDYTAKSGTLSWAAGDAAAKTISITILNDYVAEGAEDFTVTLGAPSSGVILGANTQTKVTITDDDPAVSLTSRSIVSGGAISDAWTIYTLQSNGDIVAQRCNSNGCTNEGGGSWISPKTNMGNYQVRTSTASGNCTGSAINTWLPLSSSVSWSTYAPLGPNASAIHSTCTITVQISPISAPSVILTSAIIDMTAWSGE